MKPEFDESALCDKCKNKLGCYKIGGEWLCDDCYEEELLNLSPQDDEEDDCDDY